MQQTNPPLPAKETLPTMYDLPSEDPEEPGLPDEFHLFQPELLRLTFRPPNFPEDEVFTASDLNLYYNPTQTQWYKRPDWFAVLGVSRFYEQRDLRLSYVTWQEEVNPFVVVELLSPGTEGEDLGRTSLKANKGGQPPSKWTVYEQILRIPYYVVFNRYNNEFRAFGLHRNRYQELFPPNGDVRGGVWLEEAQLGLGLWEGEYQKINGLWLRCYDAENNWIPTPTEQAQQEAQQANERAERLSAQLRALGIDPDA